MNIVNSSYLGKEITVSLSGIAVFNIVNENVDEIINQKYFFTVELIPKLNEKFEIWNINYISEKN